MEITVGIDVSKARLDVHVHPVGESFAVGNDEAGVAELAGRLGRLEGLAGIGIEASGRYERLAVAELAAAGLPILVLNPPRSGTTPRPSGNGPRPTRSMPGSSPCSSRLSGPSPGRWPMPVRRNWRP